jgi:hypothetical protein
LRGCVGSGVGVLGETVPWAGYALDPVSNAGGADCTDVVWARAAPDTKSNAAVAASIGFILFSDSGGVLQETVSNERGTRVPAIGFYANLLKRENVQPFCLTRTPSEPIPEAQVRSRRS